MEPSRTSLSNVYVDPSAAEEFKRLIEQHGMVRGFESLVRRKDGTRIWISENARAVRDAKGRIISYEGTIEDITERKRSELERQVATEIVRAVSVTEIWTICCDPSTSP